MTLWAQELSTGCPHTQWWPFFRLSRFPLKINQQIKSAFPFHGHWVGESLVFASPLKVHQTRLKHGKVGPPATYRNIQVLRDLMWLGCSQYMYYGGESTACRFLFIKSCFSVGNSEFGFHGVRPVWTQKEPSLDTNKAFRENIGWKEEGFVWLVEGLPEGQKGNSSLQL